MKLFFWYICICTDFFYAMHRRQQENVSISNWKIKQWYIEKKSCVKSSKTHSNYESKWWIEKLIVLFNHCNNEAHTMFRLIPGLCVVWHVLIYFSFSSDQLRSKQIDRYMHRHRHLVHFEMNDLLFLIFLRLFLRLTAAYTCQPGIIGFYTGGTIFCICRIYNYIFSTCLTIWSTVALVSSSYTLTGPDKCRAN